MLQYITTWVDWTILHTLNADFKHVFLSATIWKILRSTKAIPHNKMYSYTDAWKANAKPGSKRSRIIHGCNLTELVKVNPFSFADRDAKKYENIYR